MLRQLDLEHALPARRMLGEDVQDQSGPVDHIDVKPLIQIALLGRRQLVVEDDDIDVHRRDVGRDLRDLASAEKQRRVRRVPAHQDLVDGFRAGGLGDRGAVPAARD